VGKRPALSKEAARPVVPIHVFFDAEGSGLDFIEYVVTTQSRAIEMINEGIRDLTILDDIRWT
jgi:hypothetical protein